MEFTRIADKKRVNFIISAVNRNANATAKILDIGCGNGIISKALGAYGYYVTGIDVSEKTIANAQLHNTYPNVEFKVVAAGELIPEPQQYDAIICSEVLEHLNNPGELLNIIYHSLKMKGC